MSKVLFVAAGPYSWGSSRMRAYWPAKYMDAEVITFDEWNSRGTPQREAVVFQKLAIAADCDYYTRNGALVYWDVCDPSWWWEPKECQSIADAVDGVVASSQALADDFNRWYGQEKSITIPDRLELSHFPRQREHRHTDPVRFIWYGIAVNRIAIFGAVANLERLAANGVNLELTIFDDQPGQELRVSEAFPIYHTRWSLGRENEVLSAHDIALLPPYPGPWGKVKSDNKRITGWANGLAVTEGTDYAELHELASLSTARQGNAMAGGILVRERYDVRQSAQDWERVLWA